MHVSHAIFKWKHAALMCLSIWTSKTFNFPFISNKNLMVFSFPVQMCRKSYCTTVGIDVGGHSGVSKMFNFFFKVLLCGQGTVRQAILYVDRARGYKTFFHAQLS